MNSLMRPSLSLPMKEKIEEEDQKARIVLEEALAESMPKNTQKSYAGAWRRWQSWRESRGIQEPPSEDSLIVYFSFLYSQGKSIPTILASKAAIAFYYGLKESPIDSTIKSKVFFRGLKNKAQHKPKKRRPLVVEDVELGLSHPWSDIEKALIVWGVSTGFRRSELVRIRKSDIVAVEGKGILVYLPRSKTNQEGKEEFVAIPTSWVFYQKMLGWFDEQKQSQSDWLFPSPKPKSQSHISEQTYYRLVKAFAEAIGLSPEDFGGHSTRAGLATTLAEKGVDLQWIAKHLRHKDPMRTTMAYVRPIDVFSRNPLKA